MFFFSDSNTTFKGYNITYDAKRCKIILPLLTQKKHNQMGAMSI